MKYRELVRFDPIQDVKVLTEADDLDNARRDVRTFVISDRLLEVFRDVIVPTLRWDRPADTKGLLIVANYGTGKTHLMSVISAIAEHAELIEDLRRPEARQALAGRFQVIRAEIGATQMSLRDIVCRELESGLARLGVAFSFPSLTEVPRTKDSLEDMMAAFDAAYPEQGLLFVLDELLDYLRGRRDAELNLDLRFLREVGEICRGTRFRFIGGIQEALFENPRFAPVASDVSRVKDRFEQVRISREDIAYVVQERLLAKTTEQRDRIRDHLQPFTPLYEGMAEHLEEFVALFPVHPAYLRTFERITPEHGGHPHRPRTARSRPRRGGGAAPALRRTRRGVGRCIWPPRENRTPDAGSRSSFGTVFPRWEEGRRPSPSSNASGFNRLFKRLP
jgi:hypothetical protein